MAEPDTDSLVDPISVRPKSEPPPPEIVGADAAPVEPALVALPEPEAPSPLYDDEPAPPGSRPIGAGPASSRLDLLAKPPLEPEEPAPLSKRPPGISNIRPSKAASLGGTMVTLFGAGFQEGCRVWLANVAIDAEWVDAFCIRFTAPAHPVGFAHVEVENPDGLRSRSTVELAFERGPVILDVRPYEIPLAGGIEVLVEGEDFAEGCTVSLFGVHAPATERESSTVLRFTAPPVGTGPYEGPLTVTNPDGLACRIDHSIIYRALAPCIDSVEPTRGWVTGGKAIEVRGADFHSACRVRFGDRPAEVRFESGTRLAVVVPPGESVGIVDLVVENPDGTSFTLSQGFHYEPVPAPPKIITVVPSTGSTVGGLLVRIAGDNFTEATKIRFGEVTAVGRFVSPKIIEAELPPRSMPGVVAVEARDGEISIRFEDAFTYFSPKAPKIAGLDPPSGPATGGTKVVIEGEAFPPNATVRIGREPCKHVAVKGPTRIEIVTPVAKIAGFVDVEVSSAETGPGVMKNGFRYDAVPAPTILSVAPNRGSTAGGTELTVEGKSFVEGLSVTIGKKPAKRVKRISGSILEVITPDGDDGAMVDVTVKNPDGKEATAKRAFMYDARYRG